MCRFFLIFAFIGITTNAVSGTSPKRCDGPHESDQTVPTCPPPKTCANRNIMVRCKTPIPTQYQCVCDENYYRNADGKCVTYDECVAEDCNGPNESAKCAPTCPPPKTCANRNIMVKCKTPIENKFQCVCNDGYCRNTDGICVLCKECDTLKCNGENEEKKCVGTCPPERTCRNKNIKFNCETNCTENCKDKCVCKDGFSRNAIGQCISNDDCDKCLGQHEYFSCGGACDNVCADLETQSQDNCPIVNIQCNRMCYCEKGYARDENKVCVPYDQCNKPCGQNEVKDYCPAKCPSDYCPKKPMQRVSCPQPNPCPNPECKCRFNYRRAENGTCIPTTSCPPFKCYKPNEVYNSCPPLCPNGDCSQATPDGSCPRAFGRIGIILECNPACRCRKGYWYNNGVCVPYNQCPGKGGDTTSDD